MNCELPKVDAINEDNCSSIEAVQDAFAMNEFSAEKPTVYLEGQKDEIYFNQALKVYEYDVPFRFKWVGYIEANGKEMNSGKEGLNKANQFLIMQNLAIKNVCLFDSDANRKRESKGNVFVESIPKYDNAQNITKGIENALVLDGISLDGFHTYQSEDTGYGEYKKIPIFKKKKFCEYICSLDIEQQKVILGHLKEMIDYLRQIFM